MGTLTAPLGLATAVLDAEKSNELLLDPVALRALGGQLVEACQAAGCTIVVAASKSAVALVTAGIMVGDGLLSGGRGVHGQRVMVVDAAIITGAGIRETATTLRESGATWLGVTVLQRTRPDLDELDRFEALDQVAELAR
jgi:hypothetical protein